MKLLLVMPSSGTSLSNVTPNNYKDLNIGHYPPLGLMYVAGYLEKNSSHHVEMLDVALEGLDYGGLEEEIKKRVPDAVGIYTTCFTLYNAYEVAKCTKSINSDIIVMLGGPHVDVYPKESVSLPAVDYLVLGEGEITVKELLDAHEKHQDPSNIAGIAYRRNGERHITAHRDLHHSLDELPFPARHLLPYKKYHSLIGKSEISTTMMASRGCPSGCNFCFLQYGRTIRMRSPKNVCDEIEHCVNMGIREFFFFDENFTINRKKVLALCDEIKNRGLKVYFDIRSRVNTVDEEVLQRLKDAGCERIQFGVESGTQEILKAMNKRITLEQVERAFRAAKKVGLTTYADFMIGYPGEDLDQIKRTIDFAIELDPDFVQFGVTSLFPKTKIYFDALEKGFLKTDVWGEMSSNPVEDFLPPLASETFSREELEAMQRLAYRRFYLRPSYMVKRLLKVNSFTQFFRQAKAGYHVLSGSISN
ncbi:MAG: B12-binding domain-containing radical SAM protein [bacterium]